MQIFVHISDYFLGGEILRIAESKDIHFYGLWYIFVKLPFREGVSIFVATRSLGGHPFPSFPLTMTYRYQFLLMYLELL